ncbi:MAG: hypothetical protein AVDCRST_MAG73-1657 [uncultured Thermomicrobiales bacterium]|uniref:Toxin n=1 Tax=uncultured Thermomicrobiales bacterium TaxID=1645740 RepID=A0A6J4U2L4_9BACT|nr:MAG: hypothetical protein AVDCRST_MAG73-1657 [uncultured Thermomicrobiales bacterium]
MTAPSARQLTILEQARRDVRDALRYTRLQWGTEQRSRYRVRLNRAMRSLLDHPDLGVPRPDLFEGCRSLPAEQHVVFYRVAEDRVVVRVLHVRQDAVGKVTR